MRAAGEGVEGSRQEVQGEAEDHGGEVCGCVMSYWGSLSAEKT